MSITSVRKRCKAASMPVAITAPVREMAADALFAQAIAARGVDQRDAQVQRGVEQAPHLAFVARGIADLPRAEAEGRHLQPSAA